MKSISMAGKRSSIRRKLVRAILITNLAVLALTCVTLFTYEYITFKQSSMRELSTLGQIVAMNSTASLAFDDTESATEILTALRAEPHVVSACILDQKGNVFSYYADSLLQRDYADVSSSRQYYYKDAFLHGVEPITQGDRQLGTLYLKADLGLVYERLQIYAVVVFIVVLLALILGYYLSNNMQRGISTPILELAEIADVVSTRQDYSVRATKYDHDEIGMLTDAFNHMLTRIEQQTLELQESNDRVKAVINSSISAVIVMDELGYVTEWNARAEKMFG